MVLGQQLTERGEGHTQLPCIAVRTEASLDEHCTVKLLVDTTVNVPSLLVLGKDVLGFVLHAR